MKSDAIKLVFYSKTGLRWGWCLVLYLIIVTATIAVIVGPLLLLLSQFGLSPQIGKPVSGWFSIIGSIVTLVSAYFAFLLGTYLSQRWIRNGSLRSLGLQAAKQGILDVTVGVGLGAFIICISILLSWLMGWYQFLGFSWQFRSADILIPAIVMSIIANIQSPLIEEVLFRGFVFQTLLERWGIRAAILLSSLLFGLAHLSSMEDMFWWAAIISTFLAGLMFVQAYLVRKSLWLPIGIHFGWIIFGRLLNDTGQSANNSLFIVSNVNGANLLVAPSGGGAGLFELIGVGFVSLFLWRMTKRQCYRPAST